MPQKIYELHGFRILEYDPAEPPIRTIQDAVALLTATFEQSASVVVIPASLLDPTSFELRTGFAGEFVQKFVTYRRRLVILGDFSEAAATSKSLRDFIYESNHRQTLWFLVDMAELEYRLAQLQHQR